MNYELTFSCPTTYLPFYAFPQTQLQMNIMKFRQSNFKVNNSNNILYL